MEAWAEEAIAKLELRRQEIDTAIAAIRQVAGGAPPAATGKPAARPTSAPASGLDEAVLAALQNGKTTVGELMQVTRASMFVVRGALKRLIKAKQASQSGKGRSTQYQPT